MFKGNHLYASSDPYSDQTIEIAHQRKNLIAIENDKEYLAYNLAKKEAELEKLLAKVNILKIL